MIFQQFANIVFDVSFPNLSFFLFLFLLSSWYFFPFLRFLLTAYELITMLLLLRKLPT